MSSSSRPASATAARQASTASDSGSTHQAPPHGRPADARQHGLVLEAVVAERRPGRGQARFGHEIARLVVLARWARRAGATRPRAARSARAPRWPTCTSLGSHPTMLVVSRSAGSSSRATLAMTYGGVEAGQPRVLVHGEPDDRAATRHLAGRPVPAPAGRADRHRRVHERVAVAAAPGCAGGRPPPTSRTTRWPGSAGGAVARVRTRSEHAAHELHGTAGRFERTRHAGREVPGVGDERRRR